MKTKNSSKKPKSQAIEPPKGFSPRVRRIALSGLLLALIGIIGYSFAGRAPHVVAAGDDKKKAQQEQGLSENVLRQIQELNDEKESRTPVQQKIDSQLLYTIKRNKGESLTNSVKSLETDIVTNADNRTVVDITVKNAKPVLKWLNALPVTEAQMQDENLTVIYATETSIRALVKLDDLESLAALKQVVFVNPRQEAKTAGEDLRKQRLATLGYPFANPENGNLDLSKYYAKYRNLSPDFPKRAERVREMIQSQLAKQAVNPDTVVVVNRSEGDKTHKADLARQNYGARGQGIKIGVLSDGVTNLAAAQATGDLPATVTVLPGQVGSGDEGTAMLELVYDLAPDAQLYFATAFTSLTSFGDNIRALRTAGCDVIIDDVAYFVETPMQDGQATGVVSPTNGGYIQQAVNDVTAAGALYFSSAGNEGNVNDGTASAWEGDFVDGGANALLSGGTVNNFGGGTLYNSVLVSVGRAYLYWADPLGGSTNDYDLYVLNAAGTAISASSTNTQNGTQDPIENVGARTANQRLVIFKKTAAAARFLHLTTFGTSGAVAKSMNFTTSGTTHGHNQAALAYSVAATPAATPFCSGAGFPAGPNPNPFNTGNKVECFSSDGPRRIFYNANGTGITPGNFSSTGGILRQKPDVTAADGTAVTGVGGFGSPFYGTSAAAPHAGAIAALLKSSNPALTQAQIRTFLNASAVDIEAAGTDRDSGTGILLALEALQASGATPQANTIGAGATLTAENATPANGVLDPGETVSVSFCVSNNGAANTTNLVGTLLATGGVTNPTPASQNYGVVVANGAAVCRIFTFKVSATCGSKVTASLQLQDGARDLGTVPYTFQVGVANSPGAAQTYSYTGPAVAVPDNNATGVNLTLPVSGFTGNISDLNFRFDSLAGCSGTTGNTNAAIDHTFTGDLIFKLTSPQGTVVTIVNQAGGDRDNFCTTLLDDDGGFANVSTITSVDGSPISGNYAPSSPLSAFDGQNPNGTWTLNVSDVGAVDTGSMRRFSLVLTPITYTCSTSAPSAASVPVSGRVAVGAKGSGLMNATVTITDANGNIRRTRTSSFGYYSFNSVEVGQNYTIAVESKKYKFTPQIVSVADELTNVNFYSSEARR